MSCANDPAYPIVSEHSTSGDLLYHREFGLTKRELLAAMAMQGMLANNVLSGTPAAYVAEAVDYADRLLAALKEKRS